MSPLTRRLRRAAAALFALLVTSALPGGHGLADHTGEAAERAAREILDTRERANAAAQAMFDAESRLDVLTVELADAEADLAELESEVATLRSSLADSAVRQFVGAGSESLTLFTAVASDTDRATARVYVGAATGAELVRADDYEAAIDELAGARDDLDRRRSEAEAARETFSRLREDAEAEVLELQRVEEERLQDEAVRHALERQRQERLEVERQEAAAAEEADRLAAEERQAAAADDGGAEDASGNGNSPSTGDGSGGGDAGSSRGDGGGASGGSGGDAPSGPAPEQPVAAPAAPEPEPAAPEPAPEPSAGSGIVCPVAGSHSFADTWGAPRSGGRRHQGVDMIAASGVPLVAVESGSVHFKTNRLGGNSVWLTASSGTKYYYAHLSSWEGSSRAVSRGDVIGYVGTTGNAGVAHLHFEVHPGGGAAVNPYPYVRAVC